EVGLLAIGRRLVRQVEDGQLPLLLQAHLLLLPLEERPVVDPRTGTLAARGRQRQGQDEYERPHDRVPGRERIRHITESAFGRGDLSEFEGMTATGQRRQ